MTPEDAKKWIDLAIENLKRIPINKITKSFFIKIFLVLFVTGTIFSLIFFKQKIQSFFLIKDNFNKQQIKKNAEFFQRVKENNDGKKGKGFIASVNFFLDEVQENLETTYSHGAIDFYPSKGDTKNLMPLNSTKFVLQDNINDCSRLKNFFYKNNKDNIGKCFSNLTNDTYRCEIIVDFIKIIDQGFLTNNPKTSYVCGYPIGDDFAYITIIIQENNLSKDIATQWLQSYGKIFNRKYSLVME